MAEAPQFTAEDLARDDIFSLFDEHAQRVITFDATTDAYDLVRELPKLLDTAGLDASMPSAAAKYQILLWKMTWMALPLLSEQEIVGIFEGHFMIHFAIPEYPLWEKMRAKLLTIPVLEIRDALKKKVRDALYRNKEIFSRVKFVLDGAEVSGAIANWFRLYNREVGTGALDRVKQNQFLAQNTNVKALSEVERNQLRTLFNFVERCKLSSLTPEGIEETIPSDDEGLEGVLRDGQFEPVDRDIAKKVREAFKWAGTPIAEEKATPKVAPQQLGGQATPKVAPQQLGGQATPKVTPHSPPQQITAPFDAVQLKKITQALAVLRSGSGDPAARFFNLLSPPQGAKTGTPDDTIAGLFFLAEMNVLERAVTQPKIQEAFTAYLKTKNDPALLEGFRLTPTIPKFMRLFFEWVLIGKAGLSENEAAYVGMRIGTGMKKRGNAKYERIAHFDAASNKFKWT